MIMCATSWTHGSLCSSSFQVCRHAAPLPAAAVAAAPAVVVVLVVAEEYHCPEGLGSEPVSQGSAGEDLAPDRSVGSWGSEADRSSPGRDVRDVSSKTRKTD